MADGTLVFDTKIDTAGFESGMASLKSASASIGKTSESINKMSAGAGSIIKGMLGSQLITRGASMLADFGKKAINLASDLQEVQNVVDVTFGQNADTINKFAKDATSIYGLSELQAKQYSSTVGAMLKSMGLSERDVLDMSQSLAGLTGDMASFYNLDHETAFQKIRSGISGETEPLKQLGINLSVANLEAFALAQGIKTSYDQMSEADKAVLRYNYIMDQTADAQGDFARTQDSYANQVRLLETNLDTLTANIGSLFLPAITSAVGWINGLFSGGGGEKTQLETDIDNATAKLQTLDDSIGTIGNNYAKDVIQINADYSQAQAALETLRELDGEKKALGFGSRQLSIGMSGDDVKALQAYLIELGYEIAGAEAEAGKFGETTAAAIRQFQTDAGIASDGIAGVQTYTALAREDLTGMAAQVARLVELYPELSAYVGSDGMFTVELDEVQSLIDKYKELAIVKAMQNAESAAMESYITATAQMELLKQSQIDAQGELDALLADSAELDDIIDRIWEIQYSYDHGLSVDTADAMAIISDYIAKYGISDSALESLRKGNEYYESFSMDTLMDDSGNWLSAEDVAASEEALQTMFSLLSIISEEGADFADNLDGDIKNREDAIKNAADAIEQYAPTVEAYAAELDKWTRAIERVQAAMLNVDNAIAGATAGTPAGGAQPSYSASGHATGLNRVPYNGYLASLHTGEAVLRASEADAWRSGNAGGSIDYAALASAIVTGMESVPRSYVFEVDGRALAEAQAENNRAAIHQQNRRIALGRGK